MKNRFLCMLLAVCLLMTLAPAALAGENLNFFTPSLDEVGERSVSMVAVGDTLYAVTDGAADEYNRLVRWRAGMAEPEVILDGGLLYWAREEAAPGTAVIKRLFTDGARVYGFDHTSGAVTQLVDENGVAAITPLYDVDLSSQLGGDENAIDNCDTSSLCVIDGVCHLLLHLWMPTDHAAYLRFDLQTGAMLDAPKGGQLPYLTQFVPYKDGQLLALYAKDGKTYDKVQDLELPLTLAVLDPATGAVSDLATALGRQDTGLVYNAETDSIYFISASVAYRLSANGSAVPAAHLPYGYWSGNSGDSFALLPDGTYVANNSDGLVLRALDRTDIENGALIVTGDTDAHFAVVAQNPALPITVAHVDVSLPAIANAFTTGEGMADIYTLTSDSTALDRLFQKGYAADLSGIPAVVSYMEQVDERYTASLCGENGEIYGIPIAIYASTLGYDEHMLAELGIAEDTLPTTWEEMLAFVDNWQADYGEDHPEISLFDNMEHRRLLFKQIIHTYVAYQLKNEGVVQFDTPLLRKLLTRLSELDFTELDPYERYGDALWENEAAMDEFYSHQPLFSTFAQVSPLALHQTYDPIPLVLSLEADFTPVIPCDVTVLMLNARTPRMALATEYLSAYVQSIPLSDRLELVPTLEEEIENPYYESNMRSYQNELDRVEALLENADEELKAGLRESAESLQQAMAEYESLRLSLSLETLRRYRESYLPYLYMVPQTPLTDWSSETAGELSALQEQYLQGALTLDQFVKEMDQRIRMMMLEDQ